MITGVPAGLACSARHRAKPSGPGSMTSSSTRSGANVRTRLTTSRPAVDLDVSNPS